VNTTIRTSAKLVGGALVNIWYVVVCQAANKAGLSLRERKTRGSTEQTVSNAHAVATLR
jgi:hypothetical protein